MADSPITYEGDDTSVHEATFVKHYALPGDKLRVDPRARIEGVNTQALVDDLGTDVLTVSKTVMKGEGAYVLPTYEFEGVEGRFNAKAFQHELGEAGMHGVIAMRDGEMWAVPMETKEGKLIAVEGPAREIVGLTGKLADEIHPEGLDGLRKELEEGAFQVDLYHRNATSFDDQTGPVNIVAMPMTYGRPADDELAIANRAIDTAVFEKRIGEVVRDSAALLKDLVQLGGGSHEDGRERSEITELVDALNARTRAPTVQNGGRVLDAAEATLGMLDDIGRSNSGDFDALATSVEAAGRAGDALLRSRYSDLGLEPAAARDMESLARAHDEAMDAGQKAAPSTAVAGAAMAAMSQRGM
ncbi:hypothetical protein [Sphingomonas sp. 3-13AW]|uniref:hypothetical protein n=1 Tax=Sphingomonas sp. 3-13AW TaxID=3050450 RepID=UPI003BB5D08D